MEFEMKIIKVVDLLKNAGTSLAEAIYIGPDNDFLNETDRLIQRCHNCPENRPL
jgi:hypothetical protein